MAPSILQISAEATFDARALKKRKLGFESLKEQNATVENLLAKEQGALENGTSQGASSLPTHPLGVKPLGNAYDAKFNVKAFSGRFSQLPDEQLVHILDLLEARDLVQLGGTCKALYAFCHHDEFWRTLFIESSKSKSFSWRGTWRSTYLRLPLYTTSNIDCTGVYSDVLHRPFQCANLLLTPFASGIPARNSITRLPDLTAQEFITSWADKPFILTSPVKSWPVFHTWSISALLENHADTVFRAESVDLPLPTYIAYMRRNVDESPLYLFDCHFASKMGLDLSPSNANAAYTVPACFNPDLFTVLGPSRPHHAWLIIGPRGSGSTFHADPNGTSAWNAVVRGSKYWIMFPPPADGSPPSIPGVHVSEDLSEVTSPLSLSEYLLCFHAAARRSPGCIEAVCSEGEVLHVPSGWYHMVVNLEEGVAITQNFVSEAGVVGVLAFMRDRADQVSGFKRDILVEDRSVEGKEFDLFKTRLMEEHPQIYEKAMKELELRDEKKNKKSKWEEVTGKAKKTGEVACNNGNDASAGAAGFSFGFQFCDDVGDAEDQ